jgi:subtilisin family serine protease
MAGSLWRLAAALAAAFGVFAAATPLAIASPPPRLDRMMVWYRWHPSARTLAGRSSEVGSTAVLGLDSMRALAQVRKQYGFRVVGTFPQLRAAEVRVTRSLRDEAARDRRIRYLSGLGGRRQLTSVPGPPLLSTFDPLTGLPYEWQFGAVHVDRALDLSPGSPSVVVGTIDTGAADVPDLAGKVDGRWTVSAKGKVAREKRPFDEVGHGTAVASLIAGNGFGMAGFGGASHVVVMHAWSLTDVATAAALMKLDSLGVRIVNMSFGSPAAESPIMLDAIHKAAADGMLLDAATGNSTAPVAYPAAALQPPGGVQSYGLAVGASNAHGDPAFFSNFGANLSLLAPGVLDDSCSGVLVAVPPTSTLLNGSCYPTWAGSGGAFYAYVAGTSFAAPEVAGIAALIWAARPQLDNYQVADIIKQSAQRAGGWTPSTGCGVLYAAAALALATSLTSAEWAAVDPAGTPCAASDQS